MNQLKILKTCLSVFFTLSLLTGCNSTSSSLETQQETLDVTVSIPPQKYFVKKIAGDRVSVNIMVEPGASPATYEPKPQQLKTLSEAEAYISVGVPFEKAWMKKIQGANPKMKIIDSTEGIEKIELAEHDHHHDHHHEDENEHNQTNLDPHIWLSPQLTKIQSQNIYQALSELDGDNQDEYKKNLDQFIVEIDQLDQKIRQNLSEINNRKFIVFHPAWGYFARDYNLEQIPIEVGGQEPSASELAQLIKQAQKEDIKVIFAQPEFSTKSAETIAKQINGEVILITPLAADWSNNLLKISQTFSSTNK